jgi:hypothetical protein
MSRTSFFIRRGRERLQRSTVGSANNQRFLDVQYRSTRERLKVTEV